MRSGGFTNRKRNPGDPRGGSGGGGRGDRQRQSRGDRRPRLPPGGKTDHRRVREIRDARRHRPACPSGDEPGAVLQAGRERNGGRRDRRRHDGRLLPAGPGQLSKVVQGLSGDHRQRDLLQYVLPHSNQHRRAPERAARLRRGNRVHDLQVLHVRESRHCRKRRRRLHLRRVPEGGRPGETGDGVRPRGKRAHHRPMDAGSDGGQAGREPPGLAGHPPRDCRGGGRHPRRAPCAGGRGEAVCGPHHLAGGDRTDAPAEKGKQKPVRGGHLGASGAEHAGPHRDAGEDGPADP